MFLKGIYNLKNELEVKNRLEEKSVKSSDIAGLAGKAFKELFILIYSTKVTKRGVKFIEEVAS